MEGGFVKAASTNLPRVDSLMVGRFFASNPDFCSAEFRNVKTSMSARQSYGDDAIGYVQLRREQNLCLVKCQICPEHRVRSKSYSVTLVVNEKEGELESVQCHDCAASEGGCKYAVAFLMWVHRRSEEPSCTSVECYWKKSNLSKVGSSLKFITVKQMAKSNIKEVTNTTQQNSVLTEFLEEEKRRKVTNCQILKHQPDYDVEAVKMLSLHYLVIKFHKDGDCEKFLSDISHIFTTTNVEEVERQTRDQHESGLWHELRYGRITASKTYDVSRCQKEDGSLIATILGARIPDTSAMKRGRRLEDAVRKTVEKIIGKKIKPYGLAIRNCQ